MVSNNRATAAKQVFYIANQPDRFSSWRLQETDKRDVCMDCNKANSGLHHTGAPLHPVPVRQLV